MENTIKEFFLVESVGKALQEDLEAIEQEAGSARVTALAENALHTFQLLEERQKKKMFEGIKMLQDGMNLSIEAVKNMERMTVDKSVLEFEIELLERLIITSEVLEDWREHVKGILLEINKVLAVHFLFFLFQVDGQCGELEIFWREEPTAGTRELVETAIKDKVGGLEGFERKNMVELAHHIADPGKFLRDLQEDDWIMSIKTLSLDAPKLSGVVGLGGELAPGARQVKSVVVESVLTMLLNVVGSVKAIGKYTTDLEYYATRDPLTKLYNQRVFKELLSHEVDRAKGHGQSFSLLMIDADNFKVINDTYGHGSGDNFLRELAVVLRNSTRREDIVARYGGDEFAAILPDISLEETYLLAQRMLERIKVFSISTDEGVRWTPLSRQIVNDFIVTQPPSITGK